jgi:hypothetical protein
LNGKILRSQSARSFLSTGGALSRPTKTYPLPPFAQVHVKLNIDTTNNLLRVHLANIDHISLHPAFNEQADYFLRVQLLNNKIFKNFHEVLKKRRSSLQLSTWKKQQEQLTKFDVYS